MEKKPISQARIDANRANAKKSTGPRTAAGKARSSANATRHGYSSKNFVLATENIEEYYQMRDRYMMRLIPRDELEMNLIDMMAHATWSVYRTWSSKNSLLDAQMFRMKGALAQQYSQVPPDSAVAFAFEELAKQPGLAFLDRYGRSQINQLQRALKILLEVRAKVPLPPPDMNIGETPAEASPVIPFDQTDEAASGPNFAPEANAEIPERNPTEPPQTAPSPTEINTLAASEANQTARKTNPAGTEPTHSSSPGINALAASEPNATAFKNEANTPKTPTPVKTPAGRQYTRHTCTMVDARTSHVVNDDGSGVATNHHGNRTLPHGWRTPVLFLPAGARARA